MNCPDNKLRSFYLIAGNLPGIVSKQVYELLGWCHRIDKPIGLDLLVDLASRVELVEVNFVPLS